MIKSVVISNRWSLLPMTTRKSWVLVSNFQSVQYGGAGLGRGGGGARKRGVKIRTLYGIILVKDVDH
jgi:hypothetical protein